MDFNGEKKNRALEEENRRKANAYLRKVSDVFFGGGPVPQDRLREFLEPVGMWTEYGRRA